MSFAAALDVRQPASNATELRFYAKLHPNDLP